MYSRTMKSLMILLTLFSSHLLAGVVSQNVPGNSLDADSLQTLTRKTRQQLDIRLYTGNPYYRLMDGIGTDSQPLFGKSRGAGQFMSPGASVSGAEKSSVDNNPFEKTSGGNDPPEAPEEGDEEAGLVKNPLQRLEETLASIGESIAAKGILLILVFDLDGTLYLYPDAYSAAYTRNYSKADLHTLQQQFYSALNGFLLRYRANLVLIYNTARGSTDNHESADPSEVSLENTQQEADWTGMRLRPHIGYGADAFKALALPQPDALIAGNGLSIQPGVGFGAELNAEDVALINRHLAYYNGQAITETDANYLRDYHLIPGTLSKGLNSAGFVYKVICNPEKLTRLDFQHFFYQRLRFVAIVPRVNNACEEVIEKQVYQLSIMVNKGCTLNLLLQLMRPLFSSRGFIGRDVWAFIFGDDLPDVPMLRPDLEILAVSAVPVIPMIKRQSGFLSMGLPNVGTYGEALYWKASIFPAGKLERIKKYYGAYVIAKLSHHRIMSASEPGLVGLLQPVKAALERQDSAH